MGYPETKEQWFEYFDSHIDDVLSFCQAIGIGLDQRLWFDGSLVEEGGTVFGKIKLLRKRKEGEELLKTLDRIWNHAPDKIWIHEYSGFHYLCTLCSEGPDCIYSDGPEQG